MKLNEKIKCALRTAAALLAAGILALALTVDTPAAKPVRPVAPAAPAPKPPTPKPKPKPDPKPTPKPTWKKIPKEDGPLTKEIEKITVNGVTFEMVRVEGGSFQMGSNDGDDDEKPVHRETVGTFYIGRTEVTQALWEAVMGSNPSGFKGRNNPVESVSWDDCQEFVERLSRLTGRRFRLPTEAEWEYAARGGKRSRGYKYSGSNDLDRVGWYGGNGGDRTHPVGQKLDNELGLFDISGNVWEWCQDCWRDNYNASTDCSFRVFRGGGWSAPASYCRVAFRNTFPGYCRSDLGLRLAL